MPIYEYRCTACGHELETIQKMSDAPLVECPACGKPTLQKLISASGFRLKGSGWYETDFKAGNRKNVVESDSRKGAKSD
ncbi:MAG TPA: zinc ribbon domain-containing protein, partial [Chromatiales bacterium]|nr:zinc ribbon domain-containing protein [Chromatiales bacterium]